MVPLVGAAADWFAVPALGQIANLPHTLDKFGGVAGVAGHAGESFHLEKIGGRWWLVTPEGHGVFIRAVSKVDVADYGGSGGFLAYDGVYLQTAAGAMSPNLHAAAASTLARDVVHPAAGVTLKAKGDALYLGSSRFKPNYTYFWLDRSARAAGSTGTTRPPTAGSRSTAAAIRTRRSLSAATDVEPRHRQLHGPRRQRLRQVGRPQGQQDHLVGHGQGVSRGLRSRRSAQRSGPPLLAQGGRRAGLCGAARLESDLRAGRAG